MMEGRGGCCIASYSVGGGGAYDASKIDRIMLRFRPIAPKPAAVGGGSVSCDSRPDTNVKSGRGKRRCGNNRRTRCGNNRKRKCSPGGSESEPQSKSGSCGPVSGGEKVVTLPLLPEKPDVRKEFLPDDGFGKMLVQKKPVWLSFDRSQAAHDDSHVILSTGHVTARLDRPVVVLPQPMRQVGSTVTVDCVTDTWVDGDGLGCTDEERMMNLERDTCPGFISDGLNRVKWMNGPYREMVAEGGGEVVVWLVMKEKVLLPPLDRAFTCLVKVVTCGKDNCSLTLPCDVWRMDCGGFAWRLDVKAALSLGR